MNAMCGRLISIIKYKEKKKQPKIIYIYISSYFNKEIEINKNEGLFLLDSFSLLYFIIIIFC